jgi:hypothetical protein
MERIQAPVSHHYTLHERSVEMQHARDGRGGVRGGGRGGGARPQWNDAPDRPQEEFLQEARHT